MVSVTHKNKYKRHGTYKVHRGGFNFGRAKPTSAQLQAHNKLGDENVGVLLSKSSLQSTDPKFKAAPYVIIIPEKFNGGVKGYAYGVSAADAINNAKSKRFTTRGFEGGDTYTGVALSVSRLLSPDSTKSTKPYVLDLGTDGVRHGASPAEVTSTRATDKIRRGYTQAKQSIGRVVSRASA